MIKPATLPLVGGRWVPFVLDIELEDVDLTGATLEAHVRLKPDTPGAALVDLDQVAAPAQGLSFTVAGGSSTIRMRINETTMEGLPAANETGDDAVLWWDMHVTRPGVHEKSVYFRGTFTVQAGVTQ
jgi:hypothetical protein